MGYNRNKAENKIRTFALRSASAAHFREIWGGITACK